MPAGLDGGNSGADPAQSPAAEAAVNLPVPGDLSRIAKLDLERAIMYAH